MDVFSCFGWVVGRTPVGPHDLIVGKTWTTSGWHQIVGLCDTQAVQQLITAYIRLEPDSNTSGFFGAVQHKHYDILWYTLAVMLQTPISDDELPGTKRQKLSSEGSVSFTVSSACFVPA